MRIDGDAARAARRVARGDDPLIYILDGVEYRLPDEMPVEFAEAAQRGDVLAALRALFGDDAEKIYRRGYSVEDVAHLSAELAAAYGIGQGNSSRSGGSSETTGPPSPPTS